MILPLRSQPMAAGGRSFLMSNLYSFIFLVKGGKIAVYSNLNGQFTYTPFNGEEYVVFNADYWKTWQETFLFDPESCCIDFAFVSTDPQLKDFQLPDNFKKAEHSEWTTTKVKAFMQSLFPARPYNLLEDDVPLHSVQDKIADSYYVTRFNIGKEAKPKKKQSSVYTSMIEDELPAKIIDKLKKPL